MGPSPPYLARVQLKEGAADGGEYPFSLPVIRCLDIEFTSPVTFFVGENGTGKTSHFQITKGILQNPAVYCKHLQRAGADQEGPIDSQPRKSRTRRTRRSNSA